MASRWLTLLLLLPAALRCYYGGDCRANVYSPQQWTDARGPIYRMEVHIPDGVHGSDVTIVFPGNKTSGLADSGCWGVSHPEFHAGAGGGHPQPARLRFSLGSIDQGAADIGCLMRGQADASDTHVHYVGSSCYVPPPPPPHQFGPCSHEWNVRFRITTRTETGWIGEVRIDEWHAGGIIRMDCGGKPFIFPCCRAF